MKTFPPCDIRNFAIVGHASSGKTVLAEAMLVTSGIIDRLGSIEEGSTVSDYHHSEKERQISTQASLLNTTWNGKKFNIIDTPGYLDFISEGLGALRVGDFAMVVIHAEHGIGVGTERVWKYASDYGIPKVLVVNACDKENASFDAVLAAAQDDWGRHVFPLDIPIQEGPGFYQTLDVLRSEIVTYRTDGSGKFTEEAATGEWAERAKALHAELIELIAESDDKLMEKFFEEGGLSEEEFRTGIHAAVQRQLFIPVFCTSATTNIGVARLMDFVAKYGSSPVDRDRVSALDASGREIEVTLNGPETVCYVFKTTSEAHFGELSFFRVYSGTVQSGAELFNSDRQVNERIAQVFSVNGNHRDNVPLLGPGDIGATVKLRDTHTGNTLCVASHPVTLPKVQYPKPNIHTALVATALGEEDKISRGLVSLHEEDPTFLFHVDGELHQTVLSAQGELHLEVVIDRLRRRYNAHVELEEPRIPYRETIRKKAEARYRHKKQSGGAGQFAEVWMRIEPRERNSGIEFKQTLSGQNVDRVFVPSVEKGVQRACTEGVAVGCQVVDVGIDFYDGKMHPVDSKDVAFQIAGYEAFREAFREASPCLLEPINTVEVRLPEEFMGKVMGDLSSRRGKILGIETNGGFQVLKAHVPAKEMHHYSTALRSLTGGRGVHTEALSHYEEMPQAMEQQVVQEARKSRQKGQHA